MRMTEVIHFYTNGDRRYNPAIHGYEGGSKEVTTIVGNVTDMGTNRSVQVLGSISAKAKVIRLLSTPPSTWEWLTINDQATKYRQITTRGVLKGNTLIVGEDNG